MISSTKFYLNYDMCCCARINIKTNTISLCQKIKNNCGQETVA